MMRLLFAILSILLFLIGMKMHKKIHAIAGIVFMAMLLVSTAMEMASEGIVSVWFAEIKGQIMQNNENLEVAEETPSDFLETEVPTKQPEAEGVPSPTGQPAVEEIASPTRQPAARETASPTRSPILKERPSTTESPAPKETPTPTRTSAPEEATDSTGELMREGAASPEKGIKDKTPAASSAKTASPSPEKKDEVKTYRPEDYGVVEKEEEEFYGEDGEASYYYKMESFYLSGTFSRRVNASLQTIYDEYEAQYRRTAELIASGFDEFDESAKATSGTPYDYWQLVGLKYAGKDYISILYNDIPYMSNTHPYSRFDGITINCRTGKEVKASEFLDKNDQEILEEVSRKMGLEDTATWDDIDFYITDSSIVFIYRVPDWWEDVVMPRNE